MYYLFLTLNLALPLIVIVTRILRTGGLKIDHIFLFSCGYYFYWMLPLLLSYGTVQNGSEGTYYVIFSVFSLDISNINKWLDYFNQLTKERLNIYLLCTLIFYISFLLGDYLCENTRKINIKYIYAKSNKYLYIFLIIFTLFAFLHIYPLLDKLFKIS